MKSLLFSLAAACVLFSCTKDSGPAAYKGSTEMMGCFNRIGIQTLKDQNPDSVIYIIPDNLPSQYNVAGKQLTFNAELRANTLQPLFPDPSLDPGTIYQGSVSNVQEEGD